MKHNIEHIKSYLEGSMSNPELQDFKSQLAADITLQQEVEAYKTIFDGFQYLGEEDFEQEVTKWGADLRGKNVTVPISGNAKRFSLYKKLALAASIVLLVGFGMSWWGSQNYSDAVLADNYYSAPISEGTMGDSPDVLLKPLHKLFEKAHQQFQDGEYEKAIQSFMDLEAVLQSNEQQMDKLSFNYYKENVEWTLILAFLKTGQPSSLEKPLNTITNNPNHGYTEQAGELKNDLASFWRKF